MAKSIFDHLKAVSKEKIPWDSLSESDKKSWDDYMITRWLSMNIDYVHYMNELQMLRTNEVRSKDYYNMLLYSLPTKYAYIKYIKKPNTLESKKELLTFLSTVYKVSKRECLDIIELFRNLKLNDEFERILTMHGIQENDKDQLRKELFNESK
jgi:hypothetical protein